MKNLLIPSNLESDTINAIKVAIQQSNGQNCTIFLAIVSEVPDAKVEEAVALQTRLLSTVPDWATGLPLGAETFTSKYYRK